MVWYHHFLIVAVGGALGACCRYAFTITQILQKHSIFWSTIIVNVFGSLLAGFFLTLFSDQWMPTAAVRLFLFTGFLGALTTFSTYSAENLIYYQHQQWLKLAANVCVSNIGTFVGVLLGAYVASVVMRG
jgi:CrcB protein